MLFGLVGLSGATGAPLIPVMLAIGVEGDPPHQEHGPINGEGVWGPQGDQEKADVECQSLTSDHFLKSPWGQVGLEA